MKNLVLVMIALCLSNFFVIGSVHATEQTKGEQTKVEPVKQEQTKGMPDEAAMKKMMERGMPGEAHKVLEALVGNWDYTVTYKMAPDAPEQTSTGTSENKWVMDGRFIQQSVSGTMDMGGEKKNFNGTGYIGHDNVKGKYTSMWLDNMSTGVMVSEGEYDETAKTIKESGHFSCPMRGEEVAFDSELHFVDADHFTYTMYDTAAGEKFKSMEIRYTRK